MEFFKEAVKNIWRDKGISLATLLVTTLTFSVTSVFVLVVMASHLALDYLETKAQLTVFFRDEATEESILNLKSQLEASERLVEVSYTSKEDALEIYREDYKDEPELLEAISANIFPASLDIHAENIEDLDIINQLLSNDGLVEEVVYFQDVAENFQQVSDIIRKAGLGLVGIFAGISLLIILLAIGMSIHGKSGEVEIMRLVGASKWYIRMPFLIQGAFYGVGAVVLSFVLILAAVPLVYPKVSHFLNGMPLPEITPLFAAKLIGAELLCAGFLGAFAATLAVRKYLRV